MIKDKEYAVRMALIIICNIMIFILLIYTVSNINLLKTDPCRACEEMTNQICMFIE